MDQHRQPVHSNIISETIYFSNNPFEMFFAE